MISWILSSVEEHILISLQSYDKASEMWTHLCKLYVQTNNARKFYVDLELAKYTQGDRNVQEYYNGFRALWTEKDSMIIQTDLKTM